MGLLDALQDKSFRNDVADGLRNALNRGLLGGVLGAPVDLATMALRPLGYKVEQPVMGSEWIGQKMQDAGMVSSKRNQLAEMMAGLLDPVTMATGAIKAAAAAPMVAGMFIGKGAKTWDALQASKALELEKAGTPARQIWSETGTWKGPDGMWRQEIPDNKAATNEKKVAGIYDNQLGKPNINEVVDHAQLFQSYPELSNIRAYETFTNAGEFSPNIYSGGEIGINPRAFDAVTGKPMAPNSTALHELQHAIQQREGFAKGGSPDGLPEALSGDAQSLRQKARELIRSGDRAGGLALEKKARQLDSVMTMATNKPLWAYQNLAGEAEARATQARIPLDATQRRSTFPEDSYDVPINQLIVRGLLER